MEEEGSESAKEPSIWGVGRLLRDWPERSLYRQEVVRQLSLMRGESRAISGNESFDTVNDLTFYFIQRYCEGFNLY